MNQHRWQRLERYARWRSPSYLQHLPSDLLLHVASFLEHDDHFFRFLEALTGDGRPPFERAATLPSPAWWHEWSFRSARVRLRACIDRLSDTAHYFARDCTSIFVLIDWSPFSGTVMPCPIAVFAWKAHSDLDDPTTQDWTWTGPHFVTQTQIYNGLFEDSIKQCLSEYRPVVRLTLHSHTRWHAQDFFNPEPIAIVAASVFPHDLNAYSATTSGSLPLGIHTLASKQAATSMNKEGALNTAVSEPM